MSIHGLLLPRAAAFTLLQSPLWEPQLQDYFKPLHGFTPRSPLSEDFQKPKAVIPRYRNLTNEVLHDLVSRGQPFVVEDCGQDAPLAAWSCEDYALQWPQGKMRAEYSEKQRPVLLGEGDWFRTLRPTSREPQHMSKGDRLAGPYIWHVKDHEPNQCCNSTETCWPVKRAVQALWKTPYFLQSKRINAEEALDSFELWFSLAGGGALSHADAYNEMTLSLQLRGSKEWRLAMHPQVATAFDAVESHDGGIYKSKRWLPEYDFTLHQGECFVFPPGYFHETFVRPETSETCTVAATFQFNTPLPARYWRSFLPRWFNSHLSWEEHGVEHWAPLASLSQKGDAPWKASTRTSTLMRKVDFDEDGALSEAEVEAFFKRPENSWATDKDFAWFSFVSEDQAVRVKGEVVSELQGSIAKAVVDFHDLDQDGKISGSELYTSLWQWKALVQRKKALTKLYHKYRRKRADSEDVRKFEIDFLHKHAGCSLSGRLKAQAACHRLTELEAIQASTARVAVPLFRVISGEEDGDDDDEPELDEISRKEL